MQCSPEQFTAFLTEIVRQVDSGRGAYADVAAAVARISLDDACEIITDFAGDDLMAASHGGDGVLVVERVHPRLRTMLGQPVES